MSQRSPDGAPVVSVLSVRAEDILDRVAEAMELADWRRFISHGANVSLKVNLGWDKLVPGAVSAPWVVEGVVRAIRGHVGRVHLVESDQVVVNADDALRRTRLDEVCRRYEIEWVNMSRRAFVRVQSPDRRVLRDIRIPEILFRTEMISLPVMKTHNKSTISGAIKNQWGCLETLRHNFHPTLSDALVDVNALVRPRFAVMDASIALEGDGPKSGRPKQTNLVLASGDLVALDATAARIMGFDPTAIEHIRLAAQCGLGVADEETIQVVGERVADVAQPFKPARHNPVSWLELALRASVGRRLAFDTPLFAGLCWGARRYYDLWDLCVGRRLRRRVLRTGYGAQWR